MAKPAIVAATPIRRQEGLWETFRTVIWAVVVALVIRTFLFEPFNIPTPSMVPTLLVGDYLFVSKFSYGYSRHSFPLSLMPFSGRVFSTAPQRGDVIVFKYPPDDKTDYVKRLIGLPGDKIRMVDGRLFINDVIVPRERIDDYMYADDKGTRRRLAQYRETLPGGVVHSVLEEGDNGMFDNTSEFVVPADHYFMMGDNRDHSADSRADVGFVPAENLEGRAEFRFFSTDGSAAIWEFWRWPAAIRFSRIFTGIN